MATNTAKTVQTTWELRTYDVWGNAEDGWDVNQAFNAGSIDLRLAIVRNNPETPQEFLSAYPSDYQIRQHAFTVDGAVETDGDDITIYVTRKRDGYPVGEMHCTSHASLSPIRAQAVAQVS